MKYTVIWLRPVEAKLADIWLEADDRESVTRAAREIDQFLKIQARTIGESRSDEKRILIVAPLGVIFRVYEDDRIVRVAAVWKLPTR